MSDPICPLKEAARDLPQGIAYLSPEIALTFAELDRYADKLASELNVQPGAIFPVMHPPGHHLIALFFAVWRKGASISPLNTYLPPAQIAAYTERLRGSFPIRSAFLFTSGSTGTPKIAVLTLASLIANASSAARSLDLKPGDQWLLTLPLYHVGGIGLVLRCILARATIATWGPDITHLSYVPTHLFRSTPVYKQLRCLLLGGAPVTSYPSYLPIFVTYGLTEMGSMVVAKFRPSDSYLGHPLPGREVRVESDGEIWVRGPCLFQGYWVEGALQPPGDWFATNDLGKWCPERGLAITGRKDWQFISGGENIQPEEIEKELLAHPEVTNAVVIPRSDLEFGQRPVAVICGTLTQEKMKQFLSSRIAKYKIPVELIVLNEMPKKGLKIDRVALQSKLFTKPN